MIKGKVDADGVPMIELTVNHRQWRAIIDTGFNGDLELPEELKNAVNAQFIGRIRSLLAGGVAIDEDNFLVRFPFDGDIVVAEATFVSQNEVLIGTHLLRRHKLEIDFALRSVELTQTEQVR